MTRSERILLIVLGITIIACYGALRWKGIDPFDFRKPQDVTIFYSADLRGYIEPCG